MRELSLNLLDIAQNSITAGASLITIRLSADLAADCLSLSVEDNGCGMSKEQVEAVINPFYTTRQTRKVGLGIPLFKMAAEMAGGTLRIDSQPGVGTAVTATFQIRHIDRMPLGDVGATLVTLIRMNPSLDFLYIERVDGQEFVLDTRTIRQTLGDEVPLSDPEVVEWIEGYFEENTRTRKV